MVLEPALSAPESVSAPPFAVVKKRLVDDATDAKKLVVVAADPVAFTKVKFWRVEEPVAAMFAAERVPVRVSLPPRELVNEKFVVVAFEVVLFTAVKFWRVDDPVTRRLPAVAVPESVRLVPLPVVNAKVLEKKLVVVAAEPVAFTKVKFWRVEEPERRRFAAVTREVNELDPEKVLLSARRVDEAPAEQADAFAWSTPVELN